MTVWRVRKAIFPAAGLGTRFLPLTKAQPKEMLPLVDKPTIQYGVEEAIASGIEEVIMVTGGGKRAIVDHFDRSLELEHYLRLRGRQDLLAILGDAEPCLKQLIDAHRQTGATVLAVRRFPRDQLGRYGVVATSGAKGRLHTVTDMVEKPKPGSEPSDLAILGRYVLAPAVFNELERAAPGAGSEIQLTDAIMLTLGKHPVVAVEFEGDYYDTGTVAGYLRANLTLAMRREGLREQLMPLLRELIGE
jgi:UTP--glucose-1-phosphate uridylyltransferase